MNKLENCADRRSVFNKLFLAVAGLRIWATSGSPEPAAIIESRNNITLPQSFGAKGDGKHDDTSAIAKAIASGSDIYFPATPFYYRVTADIGAFAKSGQRLFGEGDRSQLRQEGTPDLNVMTLRNLNNVRVEGLFLVGTGTSVSGRDGVGVLLQDCRECVVTGVRVENAGSAGIALVNATNCRVSRNVIDRSRAQGSQNDSCISIRDNSDNNLIDENRCLALKSYGIDCRTIEPGSVNTHNLIFRNEITAKEKYGILIYRTRTSDIMSRNKVIGNRVRDIRGSQINEFTGRKDFGAGIYIQGCEDFEVCENTVSETNLATDGDSLAPGAIGILSASGGLVRDNVIYSPKWYGITVRDPNQEGRGNGSGNEFFPAGSINILSNSVLATDETKRGGIHILDHHNVSLIGNSVDGGANQGIIVRTRDGGRYSYVRNLIIKDNRLTRNKDIAITVNNSQCSQISNNVCVNGGADGIAVTHAEHGACDHNIISKAASTGILVSGVVRNYDVTLNTVSGCKVGVDLESSCNLGRENTISGNETNWDGPYQLVRRLIGETPDVTDAWLVCKEDSLPIRNFASGVIGQELRICVRTGCTIRHVPGQLVLRDMRDRICTAGETLTVQMFSQGVWNEI